jgi:alanine racemase
LTRNKVLRGTTALIDLDAARHNLAALSSSAPGRKIIAVVKADAYGHGAVGLAKAFIETGASALAVAFVSEARTMREAGIKTPMLSSTAPRFPLFSTSASHLCSMT